MMEVTLMTGYVMYVNSSESDKEEGQHVKSVNIHLGREHFTFGGIPTKPLAIYILLCYGD